MRKRDRERRKKAKERGEQIDRLVARSVIVILGGWMNVFDGHCRFRQGECLKTREIGWGPQEENQCVRGMYCKCCSVVLCGATGVVQSLRGLDCDS